MPADRALVAKPPADPIQDLPKARPVPPASGLARVMINSALSSMSAALVVMGAHALEKRGQLTSSSNWLPRDVALFVASIVIFLLVEMALHRWVLRPIAQRRYRRQTALMRAARGPALRRWLDLSPQQDVADTDLWRWVDYRAAGLTDPIAEDWTAHGYHPGIAAAAVQAGATREEVYRLAAALLRAGAYEGLDRDALNDLIGWHFDTFDTSPWYPVLGRWLALPLPLVEERARAIVDEAALAPALEPVRYWESTARRVEGLLYTLEQEARAASS